MRVLALMPDTFEGRGGIALYDRDFLKAVCSIPNVTEVVVVPRLSTGEPADQPEKLTYLTQALGGKKNYLKCVLDIARRDRNFGLIICGHINLVPLAWLLGICLRAPIVLLLYGIDVWAPHRSRGVRVLLNRISHHVSISEITKNRFLRWSGIPPRKVTIIPNAIHLDRYGPGEKSERLIERYGLRGRTILMTLGRMEASERYKGFDEILEVLPRLAPDFPQILYLAMGDGSDRDRLVGKAKQLGLESKVVFTGFVGEEEKAEHLRLADVFVMPSHGEGFGFVFLEAMACGIPVVASHTDGGREAVRDGTLGVLVDPSSPDDIERGIRTALERDRGVIPPGLEYFAFPEFERRIHGVIAPLLSDVAPRSYA